MDRFESRMNTRFLAESEKGMLREPKIIESGRETVGGFKEDEKRKEKSCFVVVHFELIFRHPCFYVVCACIEFFGEVLKELSTGCARLNLSRLVGLFGFIYKVCYFLFNGVVYLWTVSLDLSHRLSACRLSRFSSLHWEERISGAVCHLRKADDLQSGYLWYRRGIMHRTKRMGPSTEPWGTPYMSCDADEDELLTEVWEV